MSESNLPIAIQERVRRIRDQCVGVLDELSKRPMEKESLAYIFRSARLLTRAEKDLDEYTRQCQKLNQPVDAKVLEGILDIPFSRLEGAIVQVKQASHTPLEISTEYGYYAARKKFARLCYFSGIEQGREAYRWSDLDMVALCFRDMASHVRLASALYRGNPHAIHEASLMDTACREEIPHRAWVFVAEQSKLVASRSLKP